MFTLIYIFYLSLFPKMELFPGRGYFGDIHNFLYGTMYTITGIMIFPIDVFLFNLIRTILSTKQLDQNIEKEYKYFIVEISVTDHEKLLNSSNTSVVINGEQFILIKDKKFTKSAAKNNIYILAQRVGKVLTVYASGTRKSLAFKYVLRN